VQICTRIGVHKILAMSELGAQTHGVYKVRSEICKHLCRKRPPRIEMHGSNLDVILSRVLL